jgi:hypothetical protein
MQLSFDAADRLLRQARLVDAADDAQSPSLGTSETGG